MTGKTSPVRRKRRPQRSNTLKDIGRLLGVADTAHVDRKDKLLAQAAFLNDTEHAARSNYFKDPAAQPHRSWPGISDSRE